MFTTDTGAPRIDWAVAVQRAQRIVGGCSDPKPEHLAAHGAHLLLRTRGRLLDAHTVQAGEERLTAGNIVIATGRRPPRPPIPGIEHAVTHVEALLWQQPPRRLAVIGGGVIGMEFAYLFRRAGSDVVVFEMLDHILYMLDEDVRTAIAGHAAGLGIELHTDRRCAQGRRRLVPGRIARGRAGRAERADRRRPGPRGAHRAVPDRPHPARRHGRARRGAGPRSRLSGRRPPPGLRRGVPGRQRGRRAGRVIKVIFDTATGKLLGAQAFGARSPELMQQFAFALHAGMTTSQAGDALFVFPGVSEALWYAVRPHPGDPQPGA